MTELPAPSEQWLRVLADHGISILIVLFMLFVAIPAAWIAGKNIVTWLGERLVELFEVAKEFMQRVGDSAEQGAKTQEEIKSLIAAGGVVDRNWHDEKLRKLDEIDHGVKGLHDKVDDLKKHVTKNHGGN